MYHESLTDCCVMYYNRLPSEVDADVAIVLDPVIGSGAFSAWCICLFSRCGHLVLLCFC